MYVVAPVYLLITILEYFQELPACYLSINFVAAVYFGIETVFLLQNHLIQIHRSVKSLMDQVSVTCFLISLVSFPLNYYNTPLCMSQTYRLLFTVYFFSIIFGFLLIIVGAVILIVVHLVYQWHINRRRRDIETELTQILSNSLTSPETLMQFYRENESVLQEAGLYQCELVFFRDNFETDYNLVPNRFDASECCICFDNFESNFRVAVYPNCGHMFHFSCLQHWLRKKPICALCKTDFRLNFAEALKDKSERSFIKISNQLVGDNLLEARIGSRVERRQTVDNSRLSVRSAALGEERAEANPNNNRRIIQEI